MRRFNKILAVLNPSSRDQVALERALRIARHSDGEITALVLKGKASKEFITTLDSRLAQMAAQGVKTRLKIYDETDLLRAILLSQHQQSADIVVKEPHKTTLMDSLFTSRDWKLLRANNCPVLMARSGAINEQAPVLAAIEAQPADVEHQHLSRQILAKAHHIAQRLGVPLHVFSAYPAPMQDPGGQRSPAAEVAASYRQACHTLARPFDIPPEHFHISEGPAELVLPGEAKTLGVQLLVLGTVARKGLQGALLGNTAEQVLERVNCDVLVIGPESDRPEA